MFNLSIKINDNLKKKKKKEAYRGYQKFNTCIA